MGRLLTGSAPGPRPNPSPTRGEGATGQLSHDVSLLPSWEKVARPRGETDEGAPDPRIPQYCAASVIPAMYRESGESTPHSQPLSLKGRGVHKSR